MSDKKEPQSRKTLWLVIGIVLFIVILFLFWWFFYRPQPVEIQVTETVVEETAIPRDSDDWLPDAVISSTESGQTLEMKFGN